MALNNYITFVHLWAYRVFCRALFYFVLHLQFVREKANHPATREKWTVLPQRGRTFFDQAAWVVGWFLCCAPESDAQFWRPRRTRWAGGELNSSFGRFIRLDHRVAPLWNYRASTHCCRRHISHIRGGDNGANLKIWPYRHPLLGWVDG